MLERALRQVIESVFQQRDGQEWLGKVTTALQRDRWSDRAVEEGARRGRRGVAHLPVVGLEYAQLRELIGILEKDWEPFAAALGYKKEVLALLERFDVIRNAIAHSRDLLPFEEDLLSGIAGDIRNRVTIYMSAQDDAGNYYPRIESIRDSFGNEGNERFTTGLTLRPGDVVEFSCRGVDPQGRPLAWMLSPRLTQRRVPEETGPEVSLRWQVKPEDVRDMVQLQIYMWALDTPFHKRGNFDERGVFVYRVLPPE